MANKQNTKKKDKPNIGSPTQGSQNPVQESSARTTRAASGTMPKEAAHVLGAPPVTHRPPLPARAVSSSHKNLMAESTNPGANRSVSSTPKDRSGILLATGNNPACKNSPAPAWTAVSQPRKSVSPSKDNILSVLSLRSPEAQVSSMDKGVPLAWVKGTEPLPAGSESQGDILAGLDNSREEQEVKELASPHKMREEYYNSLSSDDQLSNTGFLGRVGTRRDRLTSRHDHGELLDRVERTQRQMFETMDGNHLTSIESSNSLGRKLNTVSDLLRVLIGEVARGNRATAHSPEREAPAAEPEAEQEEEEDRLSYVDDPDPAPPVRERHRARFEEVPNAVDNTLQALVSDEGALILVQLKKAQMKHLGNIRAQDGIHYRRGPHKTAVKHDARLAQSARAALAAEIRAGADPTELYRTLMLFGLSSGQSEPRPRRSILTGSNSIPLSGSQRFNDTQGYNQTSMLEDDGASGLHSPASEPPVPYLSRTLDARRVAHPSYSISSALRRPNVETTRPLTDRTLERPDELVCMEIRNAQAAQFERPADLNISKLGLKLTPPEYNGADTIDEFLCFIKEVTNYFLIHNIMRAELDRFRVSLLGPLLKGKAQKWYQHTIDNNIDGTWTFEEAMVALKQYFVKDASLRDAAARFERVTQKDKSVTELKRSLEQLSQQMVQPPSDYHMHRRFLLALNIDIQSAMIKFGISPENHKLEDIFKIAKQVEQSQYYENWDSIQRQKKGSRDSKGKGSKTPGSSAVKHGSSSSHKPTSSYKKLGAAPGKGETRSSTKHIKCFNCKKMGHYSSDCPKRSAAVGLIGDGTNVEQAFGAEDAAEETASEAEYASAEEQSQEEEQTCDGNTADAHQDCDKVSLNDWCRHVRAVEDLDSEDERAAVVWSSAIHLLPEEEVHIAKSSKVSKTEEEPVAYHLRGTKDLGNLHVKDGPTRDFKSLGIIEGYMRINGQKAHVLLDGGSTIDMMSANFASVHKMDLFQLKKPVKLQMATSGSRSVINFGAKAEVKIRDFKETRYFDVVNLDRYQVVLGTPFLRRHSVLLNYAGSGLFKLGERWFPV
jgi:hypothetical protein